MNVFQRNLFRKALKSLVSKNKFLTSSTVKGSVTRLERKEHGFSNFVCLPYVQGWVL